MFSNRYKWGVGAGNLLYSHFRMLDYCKKLTVNCQIMNYNITNNKNHFDSIAMEKPIACNKKNDCELFDCAPITRRHSQRISFIAFINRLVGLISLTSTTADPINLRLSTHIENILNIDRPSIWCPMRSNRRRSTRMIIQLLQRKTKRYCLTDSFIKYVQIIIH